MRYGAAVSSWRYYMRHVAAAIVLLVFAACSVAHAHTHAGPAPDAPAQSCVFCEHGIAAPSPLIAPAALVVELDEPRAPDLLPVPLRLPAVALLARGPPVHS